MTLSESPTPIEKKSYDPLEILREELSLDSLKLMVDRWTHEIAAATSESIEETDRRLSQEARAVIKKEKLEKRDASRLNFILASLLLKQNRLIHNRDHT